MSLTTRHWIALATLQAPLTWWPRAGQPGAENDGCAQRRPACRVSHTLICVSCVVWAGCVCGWRTPSDDVAATQGLSMARMGTLGPG